MVKDSLGLLEVAGLLGAITASDAMVKAANVRLIGIEKARGLGWMTVKVAGDVGAVEAAVQTGVPREPGAPDPPPCPRGRQSAAPRW